MRIILVLALAVSPVLGSLGSAQPYGGDYFVSTYGYNPTPHCCVGAELYRMTSAGQTTLLVQWASRGAWLNFPPQMDATNQRLVTAAWNWAYEWNANTNAVLRTLYVPHSITGFSAHHANGYVAAAAGTLMHASTDLMTWTPIAPLTTTSPVYAWFSIHGQELWSGDYTIVDDGTGTASLVSPDGKRTRRVGVFHPGVTSASIVQDHFDGDLRVFGAAGLVRIDPRTMNRTTLSTQPFVPSAATFDRGLGQGAISLLTNGPTKLQRLDSAGRVISTTPTNVGRPFLIRHAFDRDLAAIRVASPNQWGLRLNRPADRGRGYVIALSATGFTPGLPLGSRTVPLVPDAAFWMSVQGALAPLLTRNIGVIGATGHATAVLDLRRFGNALSGLRLWSAAAVIDPAAPSGLSLITKPVVLVLD